MAWYTTADAARAAQRHGANKGHAGLLDRMRRLLDKPQTSKQVTGQERPTRLIRAADGNISHHRKD